MMSATTNALATQTSPYLLQHAHNPVDWYPWSEQALGRARKENKPILLSVGYSACHWCHVMAHESFEDEETAALMNRLFVNIKVDREERPDLDKIYQLSHQLLTRRAGGWPLTVFLTPADCTPFFAGTYFPIESRFGMPSFKDVLTRVAEIFDTRRHEIRHNNESLLRALRSLEPHPDATSVINSRPLSEARRDLGQAFEAHHGGFGHAPKFPHPTNLERLFRHYAASYLAGSKDEAALAMATFTLRKMALGGIYDQLGGGFCRYSVDEYWMIPHFEKMLYDNGPLLALYAQAWQVTKEALFAEVVNQTIDWVTREMQAPDGGYYSSLDADSEGEEGKYYVWDRDEITSHLNEDERGVLRVRYGLDTPPNFEDKAWHLHTFVDGDDLLRATGCDSHACRRLLESAHAKLLAARDLRVRPGLDDKILTSWNALMIKGMASAARITGSIKAYESAHRALKFIRDHHVDKGRLLATSKGGRAHLGAYLDDHAFLIDAILELLQARWHEGDLELAIRLADVLLERFEDPADGGFFFTANDHEELLLRQKPMMDDAVPCGNGIAAFGLARLGHLLADTRYLDAAERTLRVGWESIIRVPYAHNSLLLAVEEYLSPPQTIILRGKEDAMRSWYRRCVSRYAPRRMIFAIPEGADLPAPLNQRTPRGEVIAYVCEGYRCGPPISELGELEEELAKMELPRS